MEEIIITIRDLRAIKFCKRGTADWFKKHNLDFTEFCHSGISSSILERLDDAMVDKLLEVTRGRRG